MTTFDAEWTEDDVQHALTWAQEDAVRCSGCGFPRDETFDPDRANLYDAEPLVCHACMAKDRAVNAAHQNDKFDDAGVFWRVFERG